MNRWAVIGILGGFSLAAPWACQSPDAFLRPAGSGAGGRGTGGSGLGGFVGSGLGGSSGLGGRGTGGTLGVGGATGTGGRGTGGGASAGTSGGAGTTGTDAGAAGGADGGAGMNGAGGRMVDAGSGCVATLINNGYAAGTAIPCGMCQENGMSRAQLCMNIIDCIAPRYPCTGCFTDCSNMSGGSGPVMDCVNALVTAACNSN
jgi:hypothetical protein